VVWRLQWEPANDKSGSTDTRAASQKISKRVSDSNLGSHQERLSGVGIFNVADRKSVV